VLLAVALEELTPELIAIMLEEMTFLWHEVLGIPPGSDAGAARRAMTPMALLYHPDKGGQPEQMVRVNAAYEEAQCANLGRAPQVR
jgi:hypothetical protein